MLRNNLFYIQDSAPIIQSYLVAGAFNNYTMRNIMYKKYFNSLIRRYKYNRNLTIAMVDGINNSNNYNLRSIKREIKRYCEDATILSLIYDGIPGVNVEIIPEAGFFIILNFTEFSNSSNYKTEKQILTLFYKECNIKFLVGQSFSWPNNDIIVRLAYSLDRQELIVALIKMNLKMREVYRNETNRNNC